MKNVKRALFGATLAVAMSLGVMTSMNVEEAQAVQSISAEISEGSGIPCWSSGSVNPLFRYTDCASCISKTGSPSGGRGSCNP